MLKIDKFEQRHLSLPLEYRVIGDMMKRLKDATGKERFVLLQKLNRAVRLMEVKEAYDPSNPANFGLIQHEQVGSPDDVIDNAGFDKEQQMIQGEMDDDEEEFNEEKEKDDMLIEQLNSIEKKIEEKLADLDHTFGKKGRVLEEEIKNLVEKRNSLTDKKRKPMYRKVHGGDPGGPAVGGGVHGRHPRRPGAAAPPLRPLRRSRVHAGDDGHGAQPGAQRRGGGDRFAYDSYRRFLDMFGNVFANPGAASYKGKVITTGLPASPGAAVGQIVFTAEDAEAWHAQGKSAILLEEDHWKTI